MKHGPVLPDYQSRMYEGVEYVAYPQAGCEGCAFEDPARALRTCQHIQSVLGPCGISRGAATGSYSAIFLTYDNYATKRLKGEI